MPTMKDIPGPYRFFFYSFDCNEPMHVHVQRETMVCKFWMKPLALAGNHGFSAKELNTIRDIITKNAYRMMEGWHEHCGKNTGSEN
jgi:hypothetical protein